MKPDLVAFYKIIRESVEHFDRLLNEFRKVILSFDGIFVSAALYFFINNPLTEVKMRYLTFSSASLLLGIINSLVWILEKHYHKYLEISASIAESIEEEIFPNDNSKHLTLQLEKNSRKFLCGIKGYDFLYIIPIIVSIFINIVLYFNGIPDRNPCQLYLLILNLVSICWYLYIFKWASRISLGNILKKCWTCFTKSVGSIDS